MFRNEVAVSAVPQRPRQRLRQIQVVPEDEEDEVLSRYGHVDFSADNPVTRVNVRTRPVVMVTIVQHWGTRKLKTRNL